MAESASHRFGQIIGNLLEEILLPVLLRFCDERELYLDRHGERAAVRAGRKVSWEDKFGNKHDLDFVIEKNGSAEIRGRPVAFVEAAWRRYTKHSRNKAQEIQGAVLPIAEKYEQDSPFLGAVLAGVFTRSSLDQLKSVGFHIVYFPYESIVEAFLSVGIDARFDEDTPDDKYEECASVFSGLPAAKRNVLKDKLIEENKPALDEFFTLLRAKLDRIVKSVAVLPLFGSPSNFCTITDAEKFIDAFDVANGVGEFRKFEIVVVFSNKDEIKGTFTTKERAKEFLRYVSS